MSSYLPMKRQSPEPVRTLMPEPPDKTMRELVRVLFRHKSKIILFCLLIISAFGYVIMDTKPNYTSETKLLVRRGRESLTLDPTTMGQVVPVWKDWDNELNSEYEILKSRILLESVVKEIGAETIMRDGSNKAPRKSPSMGRAVETLKDSLDIQLIRKSDLIRIRYTSKSNALAKNVVSALVAAYLDKHIDVHRSHGAYDFFVEQTDTCRSQLKEIESSLRNLKNELGISSLEDRRNINLNRIKMLQQQQETIDSQHAATKAKISALSIKVGRTNKTYRPQQKFKLSNYNNVDLESSLLNEELNLASLLAETTTLKDQIESNDLRSTNLTRMKSLQERRERMDSDVASAKARIKTLKYAISQQRANRGNNAFNLNSENYAGIQSALWEEDAQLASLSAEAKVVQEQLLEAKNEIKTLNDYETRIQWLERQRGDVEAKYMKYLANLEQARIDQQLEEKKLSNIRIVQPPTDPLGKNPSYRKLEAIIALFICLFGSVGVAFMSEAVDKAISDPSEVEEKLCLPTLVSIPVLKGGVSSHTRKSHGDANSKSIPRRLTPKENEIVKEHFEKLGYRISTLISEYGRRPTMIGVLSSQRGEGASSVAVNLATTLARQEKNRGVLLVDSNFHHPHLQGGALKRAASVSEIRTDGSGETTVLEEKLYMLRDEQVEDEEQVVIPYDEVIEMVRNRATNYAVFDMPPISESISASKFASMMDFVVMVVEAENTHCQTVQESRRLLDEAGAEILGVVLNKRRYHIPAWIYEKLN